MKNNSYSLSGSCKTPTNQAGSCVRIERCRNVYKIITSPTPMPQFDDYIKRAACILEGVPRSICCQKNEVEPKPGPTTASSIITTSTNILPTNCGETLRNRISRGNDTKVFDYPWMAVLWYNSTGSELLLNGCSGTIIHQRYVLTAAHCLKTRSTLKLGPDGEEIERECADPVKRYEVESFLVHPDYNRRLYTNDIGLVRLTTDVSWQYHIQPICLPVTPQLRVKQFKQYTVTGWGLNENGTSPDVLQLANMPLISNEDCQQRLYENRLNIRLNEKQLCAGNENQINTCRGDGGAPLGITTNYNGLRFVQFGLSSAGTSSCGKNNVPTVFTRVASYMDWILQNIMLSK